MIRERTLLRRGQSVPLQEVTDLVALRRGKRARPIAAVDPGISLPDRVDAGQLQTFQNAGWELVPRETAGRVGRVPQASVFVGAEGQLVLGGSTLVVGLTGEPDEAEASALLAPFQCRILEAVGFAPGVYRAAVTPALDRDALDAAVELSGSDRVQFAEPELIELFEHR